MLALKENSNWVEWVGQIINDTQYGRIIETMWTDDELHSIGLYRVDVPPIPDGKLVTSQTIVDVNGVPSLEYQLKDLPIYIPDLQPYQFFAMLELSNKKASLDAFIASLPPPANIIAKAKLEHTLVFERQNDLVLAAQKALGLSDQELDTLWLQAATL